MTPQSVIRQAIESQQALFARHKARFLEIVEKIGSRPGLVGTQIGSDDYWQAEAHTILLDMVRLAQTVKELSLFLGQDHGLDYEL
jgi:hypothetical protein